MIRIISLFLLIVVFSLLVTLAYINAEPVLFDYLFASTEIPLAILLLLCFLVGVLFSSVAYLGTILLLKRRLKKLGSKARQA